MYCQQNRMLDPSRCDRSHGIRDVFSITSSIMHTVCHSWCLIIGLYFLIYWRYYMPPKWSLSGECVRGLRYKLPKDLIQTRHIPLYHNTNRSPLSYGSYTWYADCLISPFFTIIRPFSSMTEYNFDIILFISSKACHSSPDQRVLIQHGGMLLYKSYFNETKLNIL